LKFPELQDWKSSFRSRKGPHPAVTLKELALSISASNLV